MTGDLQVSRSELEHEEVHGDRPEERGGRSDFHRRERNVTTTNTSAEQMLEIRGEDVLEKKFSEVLPREYVGQLERLLEELKSSGKILLRDKSS